MANTSLNLMVAHLEHIPEQNYEISNSKTFQRYDTININDFFINFLLI